MSIFVFRNIFLLSLAVTVDLYAAACPIAIRFPKYSIDGCYRKFEKLCTDLCEYEKFTEQSTCFSRPEIDEDLCEHLKTRSYAKEDQVYLVNALDFAEAEKLFREYYFAQIMLIEKLYKLNPRLEPGITPAQDLVKRSNYILSVKQRVAELKHDVIHSVVQRRLFTTKEMNEYFLKSLITIQEGLGQHPLLTKEDRSEIHTYLEQEKSSLNLWVSSLSLASTDVVLGTRANLLDYRLSAMINRYNRELVDSRLRVRNVSAFLRRLLEKFNITFPS